MSRRTLAVIAPGARREDHDDMSESDAQADPGSTGQDAAAPTGGAATADATEQGAAPGAGSRRVLIILLAAIGAVVVASLLAVFLRGEPAPLDPSTPEGVVQTYTNAVIDGDLDTAQELLVPEIADDCLRVPGGTDDYRVTLLESDENGDSARVRVLIVTTYDSGGLGGDSYESEDVFLLSRIGGDWLLETVPWQFAVCEGSFR
jgi:hypothetical protein